MSLGLVSAPEVVFGVVVIHFVWSVKTRSDDYVLFGKIDDFDGWFFVFVGFRIPARGIYPRLLRHGGWGSAHRSDGLSGGDLYSVHGEDDFLLSLP